MIGIEGDTHVTFALQGEAARTVASRDPVSVELIERNGTPIGVRVELARCDAGTLAELLRMCWSHVKGVDPSRP
ncbi:hypothetical protein ABT158_39085 [Nonomuraea sp. NPDC001636]|uniref:hypothetical protein n=1 Tax=Nonomuraea sp. NPDC001636 TaxID=3154391 RepID=UPI003327B15E